MKDTIYFSLLSLMLLLLGCRHGGFWKDSYHLPNGYEYSVPQSGMHKIVKQGYGVTLGYYLNRAYVDDRYVLGEVLEKPSKTEQDNQEKQYYFFIFDTRTSDYTSELSKTDFEEELKRLGIWENVELVSRDNKNWLKPQ